MKRVALIKEVKSCHQCPYHRGGLSVGSPMYCGYFEPSQMIFDSNGEFTTEIIKVDSRHWIASFCELPDNDIHLYMGT